MITLGSGKITSDRSVLSEHSRSDRRDIRTEFSAWNHVVWYWQQWIREGRFDHLRGSDYSFNANEREDRAIAKVALSTPTILLVSIRHQLPLNIRCFQGKPFRYDWLLLYSGDDVH
ncbi:hypothetical protein NPIL_692141 [Nephila pilipes]|uniref:Uncharacterized protein n=1 Tax=Nephila pilipes TaxID=299642 RepID=A0A8X6TT84_NEPPI|nr:hypothetical protein NPIL_692141 [Nephila pilipes]